MLAVALSFTLVRLLRLGAGLLLIGPAHSKHCGVLVGKDSFEVAAFCCRYQEVPMFVVGKHVFGSEALTDYRSRVPLFSESHVLVEPPQLTVPVIQVRGIK